MSQKFADLHNICCTWFVWWRHWLIPIVKHNILVNLVFPHIFHNLRKNKKYLDSEFGKHFTQLKVYAKVGRKAREIRF